MNWQPLEICPRRTTRDSSVFCRKPDQPPYNQGMATANKIHVWAHNFGRNKTQPWADNEFIHVDGMRLVYTRDPLEAELRVRWPGGASELLSSIGERFVKVKLPSVARTD